MGLLSSCESAEGFIGNLEDYEEILSSSEGEMRDALESFKYDLNILTVALEAARDYSSKTITLDQFGQFVFCAEAAAYGFSTTEGRIPSNELAVVDRFVGAITEIWKRITWGVQKSLDFTHQFMIFFSLLDGEVSKLQVKLKDVSQSRSVTVKLHKNKYMLHGEHETAVKSMTEYLSLYKQFASVMPAFNEGIAKLAKEDLFSQLRILKEAAIGDPEEYFIERYFSVRKNLQEMQRGLGAFKRKTTQNYAEYETPYMLGLTSAVVRLPHAENVNSKDYDSVFAASKYLYSCMNRKSKIQFSSILAGNMTLDVSKSDVEKLLAMTHEVAQSVNPLKSLTVQLSAFSGVTASKLEIYNKRRHEEGFSLSSIFETMGLHMRVVALMYDSISGAFNFSRGNAKQAVRIAKAFIEKAA